MHRSHVSWEGLAVTEREEEGEGEFGEEEPDVLAEVEGEVGVKQEGDNETEGVEEV